MAEKRETLITSLETSAAEAKAGIAAALKESEASKVANQGTQVALPADVSTLAEVSKPKVTGEVREINETIESEDGVTRIVGKEAIVVEEQSAPGMASLNVMSQSAIKEATVKEDESGVKLIGTKVSQSAAKESAKSSCSESGSGSSRSSVASQSAVSELASQSKSASHSVNESGSAAETSRSSSSSSSSTSKKVTSSSTCSSSSSFESSIVASIETVSEELGKILGTGSITDK